MKDLQLARNLIDNIDELYNTSLTNLHHINLEFNSINTINLKAIIENWPKIKNVHVKNNKITTISDPAHLGDNSTAGKFTVYAGELFQN